MTYKVEPRYTPEARAAKIQGGVVLSLVVKAEGRADEIQVAQSLDTGLDANALPLSSQWLSSREKKTANPWMSP